jgi:hypothetical protein
LIPPFCMFGANKKKHGLYYLLPGMTRANRRKRAVIIRWSLAFAVLFSILFGLVLYLLYQI